MTISPALTGYAEPLFLDYKAKFTDEGMMGGAADKVSLRYHDKERTLKILNGLCCNIFFRAADIESAEFESVPDCSLAVTGYVLNKRPVDYRKPLDSSYKKRTYILSKEMPVSPASHRLERRGVRRRRR